MGWFSRLRASSSRAIGSVGSVLKKVGALAAPIAKKVGDWAPVIADAVSAGAAALGHPEIVAGAQVAGRALHTVGEWAGRVGSVADKAQAVGGALQKFGG